MIDSEIKSLLWELDAPFTVEEFLDGRFHLRKGAIEELVEWRIWHGIMVQITSAYRNSGSHRFGKSFDMLLWTVWRDKQPDSMHIWRLATTWPWMGVGMYFDWDDGIGLHVDLCTRKERNRPLRWIRIDGYYYYQTADDGYFYPKKSAAFYTRISLEQAIKNHAA